MDKDGKIENIDRALLTDSCGTMFSAIMGTCTVTSYVESTAGTNAGGRTGLTAVVVGICFILAIVFAPLAGLGGLTGAAGQVERLRVVQILWCAA